MNTRKGFTLVELLVVIAILAILATVSVVGYTAFINGADEQAAITEAEQIKTTINAGLTVKEHVVITDKDGQVCITKTTAGYVECTSVATTNVHNAAADCVVPGTVSVENGVVYYTNNGYKVNLNTLTATEVQ